MVTRYFTLEQAQQAIPYLTRKLNKIKGLRDALGLLETVEIEFEEGHRDYVHSLKLQMEFHQLSHQFYKELVNLEQGGFFIKDLEMGLVDFLHRFEGREVFLCWKLDEPLVKYWHELETGFECRKLILLLEEAGKERGN